ncbi:MAG: DNA repair protein RecO [Candidatus Magasanikbacteria bacterium RIFCSPHIGHO2_02_FULL_41_13]|uniref:DNA repair protein RecO n=1 Tax=Candidatus Magasanikbacteria bacterium RIFCSPHIGHO2_02_FULL_41_13 TaxID=1798676 RepID=A0A1F6M2R9_9BACT|nr:MAG: DNA repair protein RecO [Candidatus Magasanikbacteria bacterium RIFCSPHIGHO2_02_FULL_41_13]
MEAIVLTRRSIKEWDEVISFYSKDFGKVELGARGTKKIVSKNSPFLEAFCCVEVGVVLGKDRPSITSVQAIEYFSNIRKDFQKSWQASFVVKWLEMVLKPLEKNIQIYNTLLSWLHFLDKVPETKDVLLDAILFKMVSIFGFEPSLHNCVLCGRELDEEKIYFSYSSGGIICHRDKLESRDENALSIDLPTLLALRYILNRSWREIMAFTTDELSAATHKIIYPYVVYTVEKECVDWNKKPSGI